VEGLAQWSNNERRLTTLERARHGGPARWSNNGERLNSNVNY